MDDVAHRLQQAGQQQLLEYWPELTPIQREQLLAQIQTLDLGLIRTLYEQALRPVRQDSVEADAQPPQAVRLQGSNPYSPAAAQARGEAALRAGEVGVILVAGGQGTRLGFDHPKGLYPIGPVSGATLFQILIEGVQAAAQRYGVSIPLYLMTSPATHEETVAHLAERQRYGLAESDLRIFCQGTMPAVDFATGRILLEGKYSLALSPDGHGGTLAALARSGCLADMARRGIRQLHYLQVDNPLAHVCDPAFLGYHLLSQSELTTAVVSKRGPEEKVGHLVEIDGRARILEYSDVSAAFTQARNADGSLRFWAGNTAMHVFDRAFLERMSVTANSLPFHIARKKVPYLNERGELVQPTEPNAVKFERFIFDLLPSAARPLAVEVAAAESFMPVKNAPGEKHDTPQTAQAALIAKHRAWLQQAGVQVAPKIAVEISPLFATDVESCRAKVTAGQRIAQPTYWR